MSTVRRQPRWRLLPVQRNRFLYPGCSCCGVTGCSYCPAAPAQWRLTVSGISDASCGNCETWNGEWVLTNNPLIPLDGGPCQWSSPLDSGPAPCPAGCSLCSRWTLVITVDLVELQADAGRMAVYAMAAEDFDCLGTNVLSLDHAVSACANWPTTLSIAPA